MIPDAICVSSWRARPGSFVGLMTLYESNFVRLHWLVEDVRSLTEVARSQVAGDCALELRVVERGPYTTTLLLTYRLGGEVGSDPRLHIRVYHDARLAEVVAFEDGATVQGWRDVMARLGAPPDLRWTLNLLLNKLLEYCAERGHRFPVPAAGVPARAHA
jgi:uncharacterized protein YqiB (DUF1249 family)